jgi:hypothetical protein
VGDSDRRDFSPSIVFPIRKCCKERTEGKVRAKTAKCPVSGRSA